MQKARLILDGKPVRAWLFVCEIRNVSGGKVPQLAQVEGFTPDHAWKRLAELYPMINRRDWTMLDELDPEHDVGVMGRKHPLLPNVIDLSRRIH